MRAVRGFLPTQMRLGRRSRGAAEKPDVPCGRGDTLGHSFALSQGWQEAARYQAQLQASKTVSRWTVSATPRPNLGRIAHTHKPTIFARPQVVSGLADDLGASADGAFPLFMCDACSNRVRHSS